MRIGANAAIAILLFGLVFVTHSICPISQSGDSFWTVPVMLSLLSEGNTNLDEFPDLLREKHYQGLECVTAEYRVIRPDEVRGCPAGSHYYYWYPIGTPVVALPLMIAMDATLRLAGRAADRVMGERLRPAVRAFARRDYLASRLLVEGVLG